MTPSVLASGLKLTMVAALANACEQPTEPSGMLDTTGVSTVRPTSASHDPALLPLPPAPKVDPKRARLGARLFADPSLSSDKSVSCATCHPLDRGGADGLSHSRGAGGAETALNTPTIYNATFNFRFNWNGAYTTLEAEFDAPITKTMKTSWVSIDDYVRRDPSYAAPSPLPTPTGSRPQMSKTPSPATSTL